MCAIADLEQCALINDGSSLRLPSIRGHFRHLFFLPLTMGVFVYLFSPFRCRNRHSWPIESLRFEKTLLPKHFHSRDKKRRGKERSVIILPESRNTGLLFWTFLPSCFSCFNGRRRVLYVVLSRRPFVRSFKGNRWRKCTPKVCVSSRKKELYCSHFQPPVALKCAKLSNWIADPGPRMFLPLQDPQE